MAPGLEDLPNELITLLLLTVDRPADLAALIRASPQCYRNFRSVKPLVFSTFVRKRVSGEVLIEALATYDASRVFGLAKSIVKSSNEIGMHDPYGDFLVKKLFRGFA